MSLRCSNAQYVEIEMAIILITQTYTIADAHNDITSFVATAKNTFMASIIPILFTGAQNAAIKIAMENVETVKNATKQIAMEDAKSV